jgi:hypothetical protein
LVSTRPTWVLTVLSSMTSSAAISVLDRLRAMSRRTSVSRAVSFAAISGVGAAGRTDRVKRAMSRRVTLGSMRASPAATQRTAVMSWSAGASLSRKPLAPARSAALLAA